MPKVYLKVKVYGQKVNKMVKKVKEQSQLKNALPKKFGYQENEDEIFQEQDHELIRVPPGQKITGNSSFIVIKKNAKYFPCKCIVTFPPLQDEYVYDFEKEETLENLITWLSPLQYTNVINDGNAVTDEKKEPIFQFNWKKPFYIICVGKPPLQYKIFSMGYYTNPPSEYAKNPKEAKKILCNNGRLICDHRDGDIGDDITLYYQGFQQFVSQCNTVELDQTAYEFRNSMCDQMSRHFPKEKERQKKFLELMNKHISDNGPIIKSEGSSTRYDGYIDPCKCVILEVKNESGQGGESDSYAQAIAYYVQSLKEKPVDQCPAPAFLLELVGPHLFISGAVYGEYVFVDRLVDPVWLVPHQREEAMIRIARIFKALKEAIGRIQMYYALKISVSQPRFPIFQSFNEGNIQYEEAIKRHTFKGTLTYHDKTSEPVFVTFVKRYSHEAHESMVPHGHAPRLIHHEERAGGTQYTAIVMEYIPDARPLDDFLLSEEDKEYRISTCCTEALKVMHDNGFCHGKISSKSILGKVQGEVPQIFIVNYKWAGTQEEARYPLSADIPEGVQPGDPITQEHDKEQLDELLPYGLDKLFQ